ARAFSYHDAARLYRAAWELPQADQVLPRAELRERLADATMFSGDVEQALEIYTWLQQESSPGLVRGRLFRKLAQCWAALGDFPQAQRCTLQGLEELGVRPTGRGLAGAVRSALSLVGLLTPSLSARSYQADLPRTRELVLLSHHLAFVQFLARPPGWMVDAIDITARQILAARALGEGEPAARAKVVLGFVLTSAGAATRGLGVRVLQSAAEAALVPPPSAERALILRETGYLLHLAGQPHEALRRCRQAVEMSHHLGDVQGLAETYVVLAPALLHLGRPGEAVEAGRRAVDYAQMISSRTNEMIARFDLAWAEAVRGRPAAARRHLEQAARVLGKPMPLFLDSVYRLAQGWVASAEGRAAEALPPALQARRDWKRIGGGDYLWLHFLALEGELRLGATDQEPGRRAEHLQALQGVVRKLWTRGKGRPLMEGLAWRLEGERLRHQGRPQEARRALEKALALFEGLGSPLERARTHLSLARLLAAQEAEAARLHRDKATLLMVEAGCPEDYIGVVMAQIQPGEQP
ncbi:MAG TPA: tetratricopeptide repeat protein, partial [Candidatus Nitrosotenuis sp.]|nr:tetratricopeptide repeat protein [Candidatus Nitrosotenuis sp.]